MGDKIIVSKELIAKSLAEQEEDILVKDSPVNHIEDEIDVDTNVDFGDDNSNGDFEPVNDDKTSNKEITEKINMDKKPTSYDYEWTDYVLSDLHDNEIFDGNPTVDSLRRLVNKFIGKIVSNDTRIEPHSKEKYAVAVVRIGVNMQKHGQYINDDVIYCSGASDASPESVKDPYDKHLIAIAETKAEGRALRKLLQLRKTVSAEEMDINESVAPEGSTDSITDNQINFIDIMSNNKRGVDINVVKLLKKMGYESVKDLLHSDALKVIGKLNEFQRDQESIDKDLKGYCSAWKEV